MTEQAASRMLSVRVIIEGLAVAGIIWLASSVQQQNTAIARLQVQITQDAVLDDAGNVITPAVEAGSEITQEYRPAGDRYSFRPDELSLWLHRGAAAERDAQSALIAAQADLIASLTARLDALESA